MTTTHAQIVATIGPASESYETFKAMVEHGLGVARFNFSWGTLEERKQQLSTIRKTEQELGKKIPVMIDLPCNRIEEEDGHSYDADAESPLTEQDELFIQFGIEHHVDYFALSFVGNAGDVHHCRDIIKKHGGTQKIIAKIEREIAVKNLAEIIEATDAIMIARGDLGSEVPLEKVPYVQRNIIEACNKAQKPVITATQMMMSMVENPVPTRAEVSDVTAALLAGSDAVMLSEETTRGKHPIAVIDMMNKIVIEAAQHIDPHHTHNVF